MSEQYDVIVAGAGPAGAQCARDLATRGYDVVVLETESEDAFPTTSNKSTAGTFPSMITSFGVPDDVVMNFTDKVVLESPNNHYTRHHPGAVLEFADFKQWLVEDGREAGAEYRFDARVTGPVMENGQIAGVEYNGSEEVRAEITIDATGPSAPLAKALNVSKLERENHAIGIEYELTGVDLNHPDFGDLSDAMMLRLDHDLAPGGYSWIFHTGADEAKVGLCYIQNDSHRQNARDGFSVDDYMEYWLDRDPRFADAERKEGVQHRGSAHIQMPGDLSTDRFMAIGDTVPSIDPIWGEGIHKGMKSARAAAITVEAALDKGMTDTSAEQMSIYDRLWHRDVAPNQRRRLLMTELLYLADNDRYDRFMEDLHGMDEATMRKLNNGNPLAVANLLHFDDRALLTEFVRDKVAIDFDGFFPKPFNKRRSNASAAFEFD
ncbi:FAD dependent oxidoreductase [Halovivax asiaticus JCM 14624]|uniref:FAD dependent oxidoreductase n=1 Tax=Halovivax asiaticus JCM 14624 TaxID=1227490 RepID=M0BRL2_9EURY|nr:digeranylgeranylglycerophospholipid reductase [Halovivax asiaticus]ELZ13646.1 FAD dependent oxidoreductase [Halovivax asiaticus JCM 14624]